MHLKVGQPDLAQPPTVNGTKWHVPACDTNYDPPLCSDLYHDQEQ